MKLEGNRNTRAHRRFQRVVSVTRETMSRHAVKRDGYMALFTPDRRTNFQATFTYASHMPWRSPHEISLRDAGAI